MSKKQKNQPEEVKYIPLDDPAFVWTTYDLGCSAALLTAGFELLSLNKDNPHKSLFVFKKVENIDEAVEGYWSGKLVVAARSYFDNIKMLKNRIYSEWFYAYRWAN